jgi:hypothetical protein
MVSGKKSNPGFGLVAAVAALKTMVSPHLTTTEPPAWRAISPVSMVIFFWPIWADTCDAIYFLLNIPCLSA